MFVYYTNNNMNEETTKKQKLVHLHTKNKIWKKSLQFRSFFKRKSLKSPLAYHWVFTTVSWKFPVQIRFGLCRLHVKLSTKICNISYVLLIFQSSVCLSEMKAVAFWLSHWSFSVKRERDPLCIRSTRVKTARVLRALVDKHGCLLISNRWGKQHRTSLCVRLSHQQ